MPGIDHAGHRDHRVGDAADRIGHAVIMNAVVAALEHRMRGHDRAKFIGRFPERIEQGIVEHPALALCLGADHDALEADGMGFAQHLGGKLAILGRHGGERDEARLGLGCLGQMRVDQA